MRSTSRSSPRIWAAWSRFPDPPVPHGRTGGGGRGSSSPSRGWLRSSSRLPSSASVTFRIIASPIPVPSAAGREEGLEQLRAREVGDAGTGVDHADGEHLALRFRLDPKLPAVRHRLDPVAAQLEQDLLDARGVRLDAREAGRQRHLDAHAGGCLCLEGAPHALEHALRIDLPDHRIEGPRVLHQPADAQLEAIRLADHPAQGAFGDVVPRAPVGDLGSGPDSGQGVADAVRHRARELADHRHALGANQGPWASRRSWRERRLRTASAICEAMPRTSSRSFAA